VRDDGAVHLCPCSLTFGAVDERMAALRCWSEFDGTVHV